MSTRYVIDLSSDRAYPASSDQDFKTADYDDLLVVDVNPKGAPTDLFLCHFPRAGAKVFTDSADVAAWLLAYGVGIVRPIKVVEEHAHRSRLVC